MQTVQMQEPGPNRCILSGSQELHCGHRHLHAREGGLHGGLPLGELQLLLPLLLGLEHRLQLVLLVRLLRLACASHKAQSTLHCKTYTQWNVGALSTPGDMAPPAAALLAPLLRLVCALRIRGLGLLWCAEHAGDLKIDCSSALLVRFLRLVCAGGRHWLLNNRGESHAAVPCWPGWS